MELAFSAAGRHDDGYIVIVRLPDLVYARRVDAMLASVLLAIVPIFVVAVMVPALLNRYSGPFSGKTY